ncbi:TraX family protein [Variovorax saccharolyticus]|uniref:TraX family protein n=1 Tax=Variovorax saccharolyticus TaxID=3053516 RepID=UPI002578970F|nr:TraX family protein [Variovorax sp. J22R187]MDM0022678.1 TraX family protein [Variovorax sp. J22R187]
MLTGSASTRAHPPTHPFVVADGSLEALKWLGLVLMTLDHVNKFLLDQRFALFFDLGRLVMPLFGFVLMYNLARPGGGSAGVHRRTMGRLLAFGALAMPAGVSLVGWWPLNILWTLLVATGLVQLIERGGRLRTLAAVSVFILAGALVEFWWFGLLSCLGAWAFCRRPTLTRLGVWAAAIASLGLVNGNLASLACLPLIWAASRVALPVRRHRWVFYAFYPAHLSLIWWAGQLG